MHDRIASVAGHGIDFDAPDSVFERAVANGFDTLLLHGVEPGRVAAFVAAAAMHDLKVWLTLVADRDGLPAFDADAGVPESPWLVDGDAALDPRRPPTSAGLPALDAEAVDLARWSETLSAAGVAGFVCREIGRLPPECWQALIARLPNVRWVAWTPGLAADAVDPLVGAGFDTVCTSIAWWDGRSGWLADEAMRRRGARLLSFPADPFAPPSGSGDAETLTHEARLRLAAVLGDALLLPLPPAGDAAVSAVNRWIAARPRTTSVADGLVRIVTGPSAAVTAVLVVARPDLRAADEALVVLVNPDPRRAACIGGASVTSALAGFGRYETLLQDAEDAEPVPLDARRPVELEPGAVRIHRATRLPVVQRATVPGRRGLEAALAMPRVAIEAVTPSVDDGRFPVKRTAGDVVRVEADIVIDGHEKLGASLLYRVAGERDWKRTRMEAIGNDRFQAAFPLERIGRHEFTIEAWRDVFASYRNELDKKAAAGLDVTLELTEGRLLVEAALAHAKTIRRPDVVLRLAALVKRLSAPVDGATMASQVAALLASQTLADLQDADQRPFAVRPDAVYPVDAERTEASFAAWYELFPRSLGNPPGQAPVHHGTFDDVIDRLPAVKAMGFDVLYFPPIHPIGRRNRKGRNNSLTALADDPGSPYAIGSVDGGHDALHPELGTFDDFRRLREAALEHGLELALDFAIQCSPDHPWLVDHPGWFAWRPDGSLRYAENPPKRYEDIVNVDFYGEGERDDAPTALWAALRDVILLWVEQGVRIFRVDNPHTKPLPFWEWMIGEVRATYPDVIFLSEAFTRPKVMYRLAKVGFSQSYTYFTWRHTKQEFVDYLTELTGPRSSESLTSVPREFFRPNFFVNTPDINPVFLQRSGRPGFLIRAALAATLSGLWGVYSGFELCEGTPVPGKEDYLDSEKYQLRAWDWQRPGNIVAEITALNRIRRENPALRTHLNVQFENAFDENLLYFVKATPDRSNVVLVAINLDPYGVHEADFELPLWRWGLTDEATVAVTDLLDGRRFAWQGKRQRVRLDPSVNPYAIWRVSP